MRDLTINFTEQKREKKKLQLSTIRHKDGADLTPGRINSEYLGKFDQCVEILSFKTCLSITKNTKCRKDIDSEKIRGLDGI